MKIERTKNASKNIIFGSIMKLNQIIVPFIMRTVMIQFLGVEYLGLSSLLASTLEVLNLAELGVGSAMIYSMYKPIATDDEATICSLLKLYRKYYQIIGIAILVIGVSLMPMLPKIIKTDSVPSGIDINILYLLNLSATVFSYWFFAYKKSILLAYQKTDVLSKLTFVTNTCQYTLQFIVLCIFRNYYFYLAAALIMYVTNNLVAAMIVKKKYPQFKSRGTLDRKNVRDINSKIRDVFMTKISSVIVNSGDTIVISAFLGLTVLAVYQNYYYISNAIFGIVAIIFDSCVAGIGNSIIMESKNKNYNDLEKLTFIIIWISSFFTCCLLCLYQPFMMVWVGKKLMLDFNVVICFCVYYFVREINHLFNTYKDAAGIWHEDRVRTTVTAIVNLCLNLILVQFFEVLGVIFSTVFSMGVIGIPWLLHNLFSILFERKFLKVYLKKMSYYILITIVTCWMTYGVCSFINIDPSGALIVKTLICITLPNLIFFIVYQKLPEFEQCFMLIKKIVFGKITK